MHPPEAVVDAFTGINGTLSRFHTRLPYQVYPLDLQIEQMYNRCLDPESLIRKDAYLQGLNAQNGASCFIST